MTQSRKRSFFVQTFGCQMNVNDSEKVAGLLQASGLEAAASAAEADVVFLNTCAVREKATAKFRHSLGRLRRLKESRPGLRIAVGGCVAQLEGEAVLDRARHVDVLVGTHTFHRVSDLLGERESPTRTPCARTSRSWRAATTCAASAWSPAPAGPR